jgi:hypothetical protein
MDVPQETHNSYIMAHHLQYTGGAHTAASEPPLKEASPVKCASMDIVSFRSPEVQEVQGTAAQRP